MVCLGQRFHLQVIIHHEQLVFQIGAGETVCLHLLDAAGVHVFAQQGAKNEPDTGLSFAALADENEHLLRFGDGQKGVAEILLHGGNILRFKEIVKEAQPVNRRGSLPVIGNRKAVEAEFLGGFKMPIEEVRAVGNVNSVHLNGQRCAVAGQLDGVQQLCGASGEVGGHMAGDHIIDLPSNGFFVIHQTIHSKQSAVDTLHRMLLEKCSRKGCFIDAPARVDPIRDFQSGIRLRRNRRDCHLHPPFCGVQESVQGRK